MTATHCATTSLRPRKILRREAFGGMLVDMPSAKLSILDNSEYLRLRSRLAASGGTSGEMRVVDVTTWGYPLLPDALSSPGSCYLELTKRCDGGCTHCYAEATAKPRQNELTFAEIERLLRQLAAGGAFCIRLTGGEPTLRQDLPDILEVIAGEGMRPELNTHGWYGEAMLNSLLERGVQDFRFSLDGTEPVNDTIRGRGSYQNVLATLHRICEYNQRAASPVEATINVVLMRANRPCVGAMTNLAAELGLKLSFGLLRPVGRALASEMLTPAEVADAAQEVTRRRRELGLTSGQVRINFDVFCDVHPHRPANQFPLDGSKCPIGVNGIGVSADGRVMPCNFMESIDDGRWLGECVRGRNILDLWHQSVILQEARQVRRRGCEGCPHYRIKCNGGCPATAYLMTGELEGRDPYCVRDVT